MSMQRTFDYVIEKIVIQGEKSILQGQCRYRGPNGAKCAIGWLIDDEEYSSELEEMSVKKLLEERYFEDYEMTNLRTVPQGCGPQEWYDFLADLQLAHDDAVNDQFLYNFMWSIADISDKYDLLCPKLDYWVDGEVVIALNEEQAIARRESRRNNKGVGR